MKVEEPSKEQQEFIAKLKHHSSTIENDVNDALRDTKDINGFKDQARTSLETLSMEAIGIADQIDEIFVEKEKRT